MPVPSNTPNAFTEPKIVFEKLDADFYEPHMTGGRATKEEIQAVLKKYSELNWR